MAQASVTAFGHLGAPGTRKYRPSPEVALARAQLNVGKKRFLVWFRMSRVAVGGVASCGAYPKVEM
eukprot:10047936-Heterocapsa_arctica.AAC.1